MLIDSEIIIIGVAFVGAFAAILAVALPLMSGDKRKTRMSAVIKHRQVLGQMQREELDKQTSLRRTKSRVNAMKAMLEKFNLQDLIASRDLKKKLASAGWRSQSALVTFVFARFGSAVVTSFFTFFYISISPSFVYPVYVEFAIAAACGGIGFFLPDLMAKNSAQNRQKQMMLSFPDSLDLLVICVEAGLSIEGAFSRVTEEIAENSQVLSQEFGLTSAELAFLGDRAKAYHNFADRTQLPAAKSLATALSQSDKYGTPVSVALKVLAQENRDDRMALAEKKAASLPAQLTVPMIVFFLPALFLVIIGPSILRVIELD